MKMAKGIKTFGRWHVSSGNRDHERSQSHQSWRRLHGFLPTSGFYFGCHESRWGLALPSSNCSALIHAGNFTILFGRSLSSKASVHVGFLSRIVVQLDSCIGDNDGIW